MNSLDELFLLRDAGYRDFQINMMRAWYFATALAVRWDEILPYIESDKLDEWTRRKTIQKACESYRITPEQKELLRKLRS